MSMRIIAGSGKGRKLFSPPSITRPTSDRAREGLFSSLISTFSTLEGLHFLDLFAGSGAVGVEALSRGAALVEAVESNAVSAMCVNKILHCWLICLRLEILKFIQKLLLNF